MAYDSGSRAFDGARHVLGPGIRYPINGDHACDFTTHRHRIQRHHSSARKRRVYGDHLGDTGAEKGRGLVGLFVIQEYILTFYSQEYAVESVHLALQPI